MKMYLCHVFLLIKNPINKLRLHQFLGTKTTEANNLLKTDANKAYYITGFLMSRKKGHLYNQHM